MKHMKEAQKIGRMMLGSWQSNALSRTGGQEQLDVCSWHKAAMPTDTAHVPYWHLADMETALENVCFRRQSGHP
jgi:hypothetical protein